MEIYGNIAIYEEICGNISGLIAKIGIIVAILAICI